LYKTKQLSHNFKKATIKPSTKASAVG